MFCGVNYVSGAALKYADDLTVIPISLKLANDWVGTYHRHNKPVPGHKFSVAVISDFEIQGVAIAGRPVSRMLDNGMTLEVLRVCTKPDAPKNCCSMLYRACWRAWKAMGGNRMITYTLQAEYGASLRAAGMRLTKEIESREGLANWTNRPNRKQQEATVAPKYRWELP